MNDGRISNANRQIGVLLWRAARAALITLSSVIVAVNARVLHVERDEQQNAQDQQKPAARPQSASGA